MHVCFRQLGRLIALSNVWLGLEPPNTPEYSRVWKIAALVWPKMDELDVPTVLTDAYGSMIENTSILEARWPQFTAIPED